MSGVKETMCTRCVHRPVCKNVDTYLGIVKDCDYLVCFVNDETSYVSDLDWIKPIVPECVNYKENRPAARVNPFDGGTKLL